MTLDKFVESDILATCNALGSEIKGVYEKGSNCIECLKDIIRYLKRDTEEHTFLRFLGSLRLLQTDLLPLIKRYNKDKEIFELTQRILVALTNPALLLYNEDVPDDKLSRNNYLQIVSYLQEYKKAFVDVDVWKILFEHLKELLKMRPLERSNNEKLCIERIIILTRNILHVPSDASVLKQTDDDLSIHDKILQCLQQSKMSILLLYFCANEEEHTYCLHMLEIVSLMFREHTAEILASTNETRSAAEKEKDLSALMAAREREKKLQMQNIRSVCSSRFNGVYRVKNMKSLSDNDYIAHKFVTNVEDLKFDLQKSSRRRPKNRARAPDVDCTRRSTLDIRMFLKKFCVEFLKTYNKLMVSVKRELLRKRAEEHDDTYYLWAICYFMQFNRMYEFQPALVSETISVQSFHHIQTQITQYQEMMLTEKKKTMFWAKRMQLGVSAYKELLETLRMMEKSEDEVVRESADALISHVFYVIEYRELLLSLLSNFDEVKFPLSYLSKLVESAQIFLKMLEHHSKKHSEIIVQKKQRKIRRKKKKKESPVPQEPVDPEAQLNEQWFALASELSAAVQGRRPIPDVTPFDAASEMSFEEQKVEAMYKIREALVANEPFKALGLLRAARELWPEDNAFGAADIEPEDEFLVLREIHFSGLQRDAPERSVEVEETYEDEDDEEEEAMTSVAEQQLDINDVYKKYATHKVVQPCSLLLANYRNNKPQTNICLVKLLHRIAWNCKMHALFFQSTIFLTFQKILHDPDASCDPIIKEFYKFAKFIVRKFFSVTEKNKKIFIELLFWKGPREAYELEEGYGASESKAKGWTEDEDEELRYLYEENKDVYIEGQDVADIILANFNGKNRTKTQIISALKRLELIKSVQDLKPEKRKEWQESEIIDLQHLFEDYKGSDDIMGIILDKLSIKRSRKAVTEKLLELNLISDRKEVRKKSSKKHKKISENHSEGNSSEEDSMNEGEDEIDDFNRDLNFNSESSGDEAERNFFRNLEAERNTNENDPLLNNENEPHSEKIDGNKKVEKKKLDKVWKEEEIMQLIALYNENSESDDILNVILDSLIVKRSEKEVVGKLLELGLIKDKKEIRKRSKNTKQKKISKSDFSKATKNKKDHKNSDSENDMSSSVVEDTSKIKLKTKRHILSDSSDEENSNSDMKKLNASINNKVKPKKTDPKVWKEEDIIELNQLYMEYKDSDNILNDILNNFTSKKTKKDITEKMLEIGLIKNKAEVTRKKDTDNLASVKNPKKKKLSAIWEEEEITQLNQLYEAYKDSGDIMAKILSKLKVKRGKQNVIEKMLELGLIKDRKEVRKKRSSKKNKAAVSSENEESSDDEILPLSLIASTSHGNDNEMPEAKITEKVTNSKPRKNTLKIIDSSEDESEPLSHIISSDVIINDTSNNELSDLVIQENSPKSDKKLRKNKRKRLVVSSDSENSVDKNFTDESPINKSESNFVPLKNYLNSAVPDLESNAENIEIVETDKTDTSNNEFDNFVKTKSSLENDNLRNKRKRVLISDSENSGSDIDDQDITENPSVDKSVDQSVSASHVSKNFKDVFKPKKKIHLLEDSDESS